MSSDTISPSWMPFSASEVAEDVLVFSLRLMTGLWSPELPECILASSAGKQGVLQKGFNKKKLNHFESLNHVLTWPMSILQDQHAF